ncbi:MAG: hypothetical protein A4E66_01181 [Syntrophus sp. PtaB.Bin001]|nr:MAG: hypothetical protein A4E66_01181 [Syntrophus sp. PtaB.Bin001]
MHDHAYGQSQEIINRAHPFGVTSCEIIVYSDQVRAFPFQGIEIHRHRCGKGLPFTGLHLRNFTFMQNHSADNLNIKGAHLHGPPCNFANHSKSFGKDIVQTGSIVQFLSKIWCFRLEFRIG